MNRNLNISVVIPVYNEIDSLEELYKKLTVVLNGIENVANYELLFIDDGSTDGSSEKILKLAQENKNVHAVILHKNFGKSVALSIGFEKANGDVVFTIDADLQDEPDEIPAFIRKMDQGFDVVSGWKFERKDSFEKRIASKFFNRICSFFFNIKIHDFNCGFKAYRKEVIKKINLLGGFHRYIPVLAKMFHFQVSEIKVNHHKRKSGVSKYGYKRYFIGFTDFILIFFLYYFGNIPFGRFMKSAAAVTGVGIFSFFFSVTSAALCFVFAFLILIVGTIASKIRKHYNKKKESNLYIKECFI